MSDEQAPEFEPAEAEIDEAPAPPRGGDVFIVSLLFATLFGYALYMAWGNLQSLPVLYEMAGIGASTPWSLLIIGLILPPVLFAAAMAIGRGRQLVARAGILLAAFAVHAQATLLLEAFARQAAASALI